MKIQAVRAINLSRNRFVKGNAQESINAAEESLFKFEEYVKTLIALFDARFVFFRQDVWYDALTNLLLPKFDKDFCRLLTLEEFSALTKDSGSGDFFFKLCRLQRSVHFC